MAKQLQFSINELFATMIVGAVTAWLISLGAAWLIPALLAMVVGIAYRKKSDYPLPLLMFGGAGVGIAVTISAIMSYTLIQGNTIFLGPLSYIGLLALAIAWLITLVIFLQFRKLILGKLPKSGSKKIRKTEELNAS